LPQPGGFYGNSLALGSADVTLLALTNAYRSLANGGLYSPVSLHSTSSKPVRVADAAAVYLATDILSDNNARIRTFGLNSLLATRSFAAVKTGTSKDMRDNWCVGYTDRYTVGVWIGNADGQAMHNVSGVSGAAPVWRALVQYLHEGRPSRPPQAPPGVIATPVQFEAQREPTRDEVFIAGTERSLQRLGTQVAGAPQRFGIATPRDGSIFAIDPDIPPAAQRITFEGEPGVWVLDGKRLGSAPRLSWSPWPGRHELSLIGQQGQTLQSVRFEVRGAVVKTAQGQMPSQSRVQENVQPKVQPNVQIQTAR
jgi:penicillin-binding protein 1C